MNSSVILILMLLVFSMVGCTTQPAITPENLCGQWKSINPDKELWYNFSEDGTHYRISGTNITYRGSYDISGESIRFTEKNGEQKKAEIHVMSSQVIELGFPFGFGGAIAIRLRKTSGCGTPTD